LASGWAVLQPATDDFCEESHEEEVMYTEASVVLAMAGAIGVGLSALWLRDVMELRQSAWRAGRTTPRTQEA
jgi:hypothetical protein